MSSTKERRNRKFKEREEWDKFEKEVKKERGNEIYMCTNIPEDVDPDYYQQGYYDGVLPHALYINNIIIPLWAINDKTITTGAKILYGLFVKITNNFSYTRLDYSNNYLAKYLNASPVQISNWLKELIDWSYITTNGKQGEKRIIYMTRFQGTLGVYI